MSASLFSVFVLGWLLATPVDPESDPDLPSGLAIDPAQYLLLGSEHVGLLRGVPDAARLPYSPRVAAIRQLEKRLATRPLANPATWTSIGPAPIPNGQTTTFSVPVSGRTTAIAIHPTNPNTVYVGTAQGGVYRSTDGGTFWTPLMDAALSLAIGAVTIDPTDPTTLLVGTGEGNFTADSFFGVGLYIVKNADSASPLLTGPFNLSGTAADVFTNSSIVKVLVSPTDHNVVFLATSSGFSGMSGDVGAVLPPRNLYRSVNAFSASPTFTSLTVVPSSTNLPVTSAIVDPNDPDVVLCGVYGLSAGEGGVYRTTNALAATPTFTKVLSHSTGVNVKLDAVKVGSAVTMFSASGELAAGCTSGARGTLRRSTDEGLTWSTPITSANGFCGGQCFYDLPVAADPTNANNILLGGGTNTGTAPCRSSVLLRSTDAGATFVRSDVRLHVDEHAIAFAPSNPAVVYTGNDGGIFKSTDGGASWSSLNNATFNATQFESLAVHPSSATFTIGGTQDNGTAGFFSAGAWNRIDYGEGGGFALIDQSAADTTAVTMYHTYFNLTNLQIGLARVTNVANATDGGWSFLGCPGGIPNGISCLDSVLFYAPMALGPGNPNTLYFGTDRLYRSSNMGTTMPVASQSPIISFIPISAIGISRQNDNVRIVGLRNGKVFATTTGSTTLIDVTGASMPARYVARAVIDPNDSNKAYVTIDGYGLPSGQHVWKNANLAGGAASWVAAGTGIPDVPVNAFCIDPNASTHLFAGTDIGVYASTDGGTTWNPLGSGLPRVAVFDMAFVNSATPASRILRIATHGRGMWEITPPLPLAVTSPAGGGTFCPGDPVLLSVTASGGAPSYGYQWRKDMMDLMDGVSIGGSQTPTLSINPAAAGDTGTYDCVVTDALTTAVTSSGAAVTVVDSGAPVVTAPTAAAVTQTLCQ